MVTDLDLISALSYGDRLYYGKTIVSEDGKLIKTIVPVKVMSVDVCSGSLSGVDLFDLSNNERVKIGSEKFANIYQQGSLNTDILGEPD